MAAPEPSRLQTRSGVLEYAVAGEGRPAIVLFSGAGMSLAAWDALRPGIESLGTVLAWNRFGVEGSDAPSRLQSGALVVATVRELLGYAAIEPPYVLVGHSLGGLYAQLFARLHPADVAAVMLVESRHARDHEILRIDEPRLARSLAKVQSLDEDAFRDNLHAELESLPHLAAELEGAGDFPAVPLTVVTGGIAPPPSLVSGRLHGRLLANQRALAALSPLGESCIAAKSGHFPQLSEPQLVLDALARLVERTAWNLQEG